MNIVYILWKTIKIFFRHILRLIVDIGCVVIGIYTAIINLIGILVIAAVIFISETRNFFFGNGWRGVLYILIYSFIYLAAKYIPLFVLGLLDEIADSLD